MDMSKNVIPDDVRRVHLMAVCGTAMGALACMLTDLGCEVTGSDQKVYPPMSDFLAGRGIRIMDGFRPENLGHSPDLVVVGNAVTRVNPEAVALERLGLPFCSMPQAINRFVAAGRQTLMVTGTHGKTTTTALLAWILHAAGCDPAFVIGGILKNFQSNYRLGNGGWHSSSRATSTTPPSSTRARSSCTTGRLPRCSRASSSTTPTSTGTSRT